MATKTDDYPKLPLEYPLREALVIYGKRLAIFLAVVLANAALLGLVVLTIYNVFIGSAAIVILLFNIGILWWEKKKWAQEERKLREWVERVAQTLRQPEWVVLVVLVMLVMLMLMLALVDRVLVGLGLVLVLVPVAQIAWMLWRLQ